jgi:DNA-binding IclR family transcriptional regulator
MKFMDVKKKKPAVVERPGAPALEKGLDLLESLANEPEGLTQKALAEQVDRSVGEIFRMLGVLEQRGYVARDTSTGLYSLTLRLFELANRHPPIKRLQHAALNAMSKLSEAIGHSCHLIMMNANRILVVAQVEPDRPMGWSVKLGASFPFSANFASARVLAAFQTPERREEMIELMAEQDGTKSRRTVAEKLKRIAEAGHEVAESRVASGVVDISCPVFNQFGVAVAALTVPYLAQPTNQRPAQELAAATAAAAHEITLAIGGAAGAVEPT